MQGHGGLVRGRVWLGSSGSGGRGTSSPGRGRQSGLFKGHEAIGPGQQGLQRRHPAGLQGERREVWTQGWTRLDVVAVVKNNLKSWKGFNQESGQIWLLFLTRVSVWRLRGRRQQGRRGVPTTARLVLAGGAAAWRPGQ